MYSMVELAQKFVRLETELAALVASGASEDELWLAIEDATRIPASAVRDEDRLWWWQRLYDVMEKHHLTELSAFGAGK